MKKEYYYQVYGLRVKSQIQMDELPIVNEGDTDVIIIMSPAPIEYRSQCNSSFQPSMDLLWFYTGDRKETGASFWIIKGSTIYVQVSEHMKLLELKSYILGTAFGFLMIQRQSIAIHGSGLRYREHSFIITGESGAGKSSMCATILKDQGYFIADDVCAVVSNKQETVIFPAYPQQKLCKNMALQEGYDLKSLIYLGEERDKYAVRFTSNYIAEETRLDAIFLLEIWENKEVKVREIKGSEKLQRLIQNVYRTQVFRYMKMPPNYMMQLISLANSIPMYHIYRPENRDTLDEIKKIIVERILM